MHEDRNLGAVFLVFLLKCGVPMILYNIIGGVVLHCLTCRARKFAFFVCMHSAALNCLH